jgi:hypothetical protein
MPRLPLPLDLVPVDRVAGALLVPASAVRHGSVALARTARNWELTLLHLAGREVDGDVPRATRAAEAVEEMLGADADHGTPQASASSTAQPADDGDVAPDHAGSDDGHGVPAAEAVDLRERPGSDALTGGPGAQLSSDDLPVEGRAELSPQAAGAAVADLDAADLDVLLAYEKAHGHRPAYLLMLQHRIESVTA